jgi:hypothetical protein
MTPCSPNPQSLTGSEYKKSKVGFPIRKSSDQSLFAAPQGLSQRTTSFIASQRQGIHRMLLLHLITLMIDVRTPAKDRSLKQKPGPKIDRRQGSAPRQRSERPVFGSSPKTFACLTHSAANPCGGRWSPEQTAPAGQMHYLFTMSNTRDRAPSREPSRIPNLNRTKASTPKGRHTRPKPQNPKKWWSQTGSNRRPEACKATALPTELWPLLVAWPQAPAGTSVPLGFSAHERGRPFGLADLTVRGGATLVRRKFWFGDLARSAGSAPSRRKADRPPALMRGKA